MKRLSNILKIKIKTFQGKKINPFQIKKKLSNEIGKSLSEVEKNDKIKNNTNLNNK